MNPIARVRYSIRRLRRLLKLWRSPNARFLNFAPGHFASPLPDDAELRRDGPRLHADPGPGLPGIELHADAQLVLLNQLRGPAADWPFPDRPAAEWRYYADNEFFGYADGAALFALLRRQPPRRIVEVGSGFSSALMLDTDAKYLNNNINFTFIEPYPTRLNALLTAADRTRCTVVEKRVQDVADATFTALEAGDLLFVDSSHVTKAGSDVNHLLFHVLPLLQPGVRVHVHDVFWPFEYPPTWWDLGYAWNEQYILRAFLQYNSAFAIEFFPSYLERHHAAAVAECLPVSLRRTTANPALGGGSLYLVKRG
jgi:predicted O-methyltransferase YrrM